MIGEGAFWVALSKDYAKPVNQICPVTKIPISGVTGNYIDPYTGMEMTPEMSNMWKTKVQQNQ